MIYDRVNNTVLEKAKQKKRNTALQISREVVMTDAVWLTIHKYLQN